MIARIDNEIAKLISLSNRFSIITNAISVNVRERRKPTI
jgi:hypothetical protein